MEKTIKTGKPLSTLSLRLAAMLLQELSIYEPRKLTSRNEMIKILGASKTAIIKSLSELEEVGFIIRVSENELENAVLVNKQDEKIIKEMINNKKEEDIKKRRFGGKFLINSNYNQTEIEVVQECEYDLIKILGELDETQKAQLRKQIKDMIRED